MSSPSRGPIRMARTRSRNSLLAALEESGRPVYAVDHERRIVFCNDACAAWIHVDADELLGQVCNYHAGERGLPVQVAACALCPPPQVFLGELAHGVVVRRRDAETIERRAATFVPCGTSESLVVLVTLGDLQSEHEAESPNTELADSAALHERLQVIARQMRARFRLDLLVGDSPPARRIRDQARAAITSRARTLIVGPPGSGREHIARTILFADKPDTAVTVLPLDCARLDGDMLQSAVSDFVKRSRATTAALEFGVLLLEVDQLSAAGQAALLPIVRGASIQMRFLATSRRTLLPSAAESGHFLPELASLLSTLVIELPRLADRREDIPILAQRFVEEHNVAGGTQLAGLSPAALDRLASLPWPGNVEELASVIREACTRVDTVWIGEADLPPRVRAVVAAGLHPRHDPEEIDLDAFLLDVERELILRAMQIAKGNKAQAARLLGVRRPRVLRRLEHFGFAPREPDEIEFEPADDDNA